MADENGDWLDLATTVVALRRELEKARELGAAAELKFTVEEIDIELQVVAKKTAGVESGVKFWVMSGKVKGELGEEVVQKVRLRLKPKGPDGDCELSDTDQE